MRVDPTILPRESCKGILVSHSNFQDCPFCCAWMLWKKAHKRKATKMPEIGRDLHPWMPVTDMRWVIFMT